MARAIPLLLGAALLAVLTLSIVFDVRYPAPSALDHPASP